MSYALLSRKSEAASAAKSKRDFTGLRIGGSNDSFEREADRVAEEVMAGDSLHWSFSSMTLGAPLQRKCACGGSGECAECKEEKTIQRRSSGSASAAHAPPIVDEVLRLPGQPLDAASRAFFEPRFGHGFSRVRVHADAKAARSAQAVNARAYTVGHDVVFAPGQYAPLSVAGKQLLAHELTHVLQQSGGGASPKAGSQSPGGDQRESEGDGSAARIDNSASQVVLPTRAPVRLMRSLEPESTLAPSPEPEDSVPGLGTPVTPEMLVERCLAKCRKDFEKCIRISPPGSDLACRFVRIGCEDDCRKRRGLT